MDYDEKDTKEVFQYIWSLKKNNKCLIDALTGDRDNRAKNNNPS